MPDGNQEQANADAARNRRDLAIVARVARSLLGAIELEDQLRLTLDLLTEALAADRGSVMLLDDSGHLEVRCAAGLPPEALGVRTPLGHGIAGWVAEHNAPVVLHGDVDDDRFEGVDARLGSALSLPMAVTGRVVGVLNLVRRTGARFKDEDLRLAESLADLAALAAERAGLYSRLRDREARVTQLLAAVIQAQERERRRIAADIHDGFLQDLTALFLKAELAKMRLAGGDVARGVEVVESMQEGIQEEMEALRDFIFEVRPLSLDQVGLGATLKAMVDQIAAEGRLQAEWRDETHGRRFGQTLETILYRVAQEALRNVVRHAKAGTVCVTLSLDRETAVLIVDDDGRGITPEQIHRHGHYGVETMRERVQIAGGTFEIAPHPEGGTRVEARVPIVLGIDENEMR